MKIYPSHIRGLLGTVVLAICLIVANPSVAAVDMPEFALPSAVSGKTVSSEEFKGKAILLTFFATWCPPCRQEIPVLKELHIKYGPEGFAVLGLSVDEGGPKIVAKLVEQDKINYPVLMANRSIARKFGGIAGIPTSFLINKKGQVVKKYPGYVSQRELERDIQSVL